MQKAFKGLQNKPVELGSGMGEKDTRADSRVGILVLRKNCLILFIP
jgi:hypothetical protein